MNQNKLKAWISAFRLRTLPLSFSVILMGASIGYVRTDWDTNFSWSVFSLILITTLLLQVLSNLANDYGDAIKGADNEGRIGPERAVQSGIISRREMLSAIIVVSMLSLISGIWLLLEAFSFKFNAYFLIFFVLGLLSIAAAIKYTVGKKAYGYSGLGDLFVFIFFGLIGVIGTAYLLAGAFHWTMFLPAITMGCYSVAVLNLNNMRDRENDQKVGKNTLAVKLGHKKSKIYHYSIFLIAYLSFPLPFIIEGLSSGFSLLFLTFIPSALIHFFHLKKVFKIEEPQKFDPELKKVAISAFVFALLFFCTILYLS
ncbi:1,4-dihydroxy-2-naphthoate octaprenyltransferase [Crocinitomix algicola]|uniref:1,4-dihydroxy-2-naphthoate octaprenyltransferase n=1 Tax=Crocinitomix algicola TaxID=1740263 RepID=UPI000872A7F3|nr:1,4-dihydroxy-2-naphthoate octaprenyltransferase [Crocinitomix algicola]